MAEPSTYLPQPPPLPPARGAAAAEEEPLTSEMRRRRNRLVALLVLVPFSFPAWYAARRRDPELARRTRLAVVVNLWQTGALVVIAALALGLAANRDAIVTDLSERLGEMIYQRWYVQ